MSQTFEEWEKSAFTGGLQGGRSIAKLAWDAGVEAERDSAKAQVALERAAMQREAADVAYAKRHWLHAERVETPDGEEVPIEQTPWGAILALPADQSALERHDAELSVKVHQQGFDAGFDGAERAAFERERKYILELKAQTAAMLEKAAELAQYVEGSVTAEAPNRYVYQSELSKRIRTLIPTDAAAALAEQVNAAERRMADKLANLSDKIVADRVQQAVREEAEWWGYAHCHAFEADEFNCKLCQRLAAHRAAAGAPFPVDKHAKPDILDNKYTEWPLPGPSEDKQ